MTRHHWRVSTLANGEKIKACQNCNLPSSEAAAHGVMNACSKVHEGEAMTAATEVWAKQRAVLTANNDRLREVIEAIDSEIVLGGHLKELVDAALGDQQTAEEN